MSRAKRVHFLARLRGYVYTVDEFIIHVQYVGYYSGNDDLLLGVISQCDSGSSLLQLDCSEGFA